MPELPLLLPPCMRLWLPLLFPLWLLMPLLLIPDPL
jgi:hypothetical protein